MDWLNDWWKTIVGFLMIAVGIGTNLRRLDEDEEWRKAHIKFHTDNPVVLVLTCKENRLKAEADCALQRSHCSKVVGLQFNQGEEKFEALKTLIVENDQRNEIRHKDSMTAFNEMFKAILGRDRRE